MRVEIVCAIPARLLNISMRVSHDSGQERRRCQWEMSWDAVLPYHARRAPSLAIDLADGVPHPSTIFLSRLVVDLCYGEIGCDYCVSLDYAAIFHR
jgi:hypothetical protein